MPVGADARRVAGLLPVPDATRRPTGLTRRALRREGAEPPLAGRPVRRGAPGCSPARPRRRRHRRPAEAALATSRRAGGRRARRSYDAEPAGPGRLWSPGALLVVSGDTGVAHVASAYGTPSVVLFGPVSPARWGPPADPRHQVLWHGDGTGDPHGADLDPALQRITVDEVGCAVDRAVREAEVPSRR